VLNGMTLRYFKCFDELHLPIRKLTLLSGTNASGKSSVLQSLCLLHQTMSEREWSRHLLLNGKTVQLGTVVDVVDQVNGRRDFEIGLDDATMHCSWLFSGDKDDMLVEVKRFSLDGEDFELPSILHHLFPADLDIGSDSLAERIRCLSYISAERAGPRQFYPLQDERVASVVGPSGEHAASLLHLRGEEQVLEGIQLPDVVGTLWHQAGARMAQFFPGSGFQVTPVPQANAVTLGLRTSIDTDFHRPVHVGFGLTQVLPIIVAALAAKEGELLLIENPEVHLHPRGQVEMGVFLAQVSAAGVQVILETHSDHILNGIRKAVRAGQVNHEDVALHFFQPRAQNASQVHSPNLAHDGSIDYWPDGFFDQFERDMRHLAGWDD
jgi:predicted ATPase